MQGSEAVAPNGPEQPHDDVGGRLAVGQGLARAADTGEHVGDDGPTVGPERGLEPGAAAGVGDGRERAGDGGGAFAASASAEK